MFTRVSPWQPWYTLASKSIWTPIRGMKILKYCTFLEAFSIFFATQGKHLPPSRPPPPWLCHHPPATTMAASPFLGVCISIWMLFPVVVTSLILQLHELYLHHWKAWSLSRYFLHSFLEKLHIKGSAGHLVNAVNLCTVLKRIMQSSMNIAATQTILTSLESSKTWLLNLSLYFG